MNMCCCLFWNLKIYRYQNNESYEIKVKHLLERSAILDEETQKTPVDIFPFSCEKTDSIKVCWVTFILAICCPSVVLLTVPKIFTILNRGCSSQFISRIIQISILLDILHSSPENYKAQRRLGINYSDENGIFGNFPEVINVTIFSSFSQERLYTRAIILTWYLIQFRRSRPMTYVKCVSFLIPLYENVFIDKMHAILMPYHANRPILKYSHVMYVIHGSSLLSFYCTIMKLVTDKKLQIATNILNESYTNTKDICSHEEVLVTIIKRF